MSPTCGLSARTRGYLDHAATTPVRPEAVRAMCAALDAGNTTGGHAVARTARRMVEDARDTLATLLGVSSGDIVFTSGGTEADNLAVVGLDALARGTPWCSAVEHQAVLAPVADRGGSTLVVDDRGVVDAEAIEAAGRAGEVSVVSIMAVNNETGVIQPIGELAQVVRSAIPEAMIHCDAVQAFGWLEVAEIASHVDALSLSAHKFGGPPGVGVLVLGPRAQIRPQMLGGGQERGRRAGSLNVAGIVGMAEAAAVTAAQRHDESRRVGALRDRLVGTLQAEVDDLIDTTVTGHHRSEVVPGIAHLCIRGVESESLLFLLDEAGVAASAGSSCSSGAVSVSHVLAAMGVDSDWATGALRLSMGWTTTDDDVDLALEVIPDAVRRLRKRRR
jgi:cysteine desulfurase